MKTFKRALGLLLLAAMLFSLTACGEQPAKLILPTPAPEAVQPTEPEPVPEPAQPTEPEPVPEPVQPTEPEPVAEPVQPAGPAEPAQPAVGRALPLNAEHVAVLQTLKGKTAGVAGNITEFAQSVYYYIGLDVRAELNGTTSATIMKQLFRDNTGAPIFSGHAYSFPTAAPADLTAISRMLLPEFCGGPAMIESARGVIGSPDDLQPGDLLYLLRRSGSVYWVGVYQGGGCFFFCEYTSKQNPVYVQHDFSGADGASRFAALLTENPHNGEKWENYLVLRPSRNYDDINTDALIAGWTLPEGVELPPVVPARNRFADIGESTVFGGTITEFAEIIYRQAGVEVKQITKGASGATILKELYYDNTRSPLCNGHAYTLNPTAPEEYRALRGIIVSELCGGPAMTNDGTQVFPELDTKLLPGDILLLINRRDKVYWSGVYLGDRRMALCEYTVGEKAVYRILDLAGGEGETLYRSLLTGTTEGPSCIWENYLLLRPSLAVSID